MSITASCSLFVLYGALTVSQTLNPHWMQMWRFWKKAQKNLEIVTLNHEISKICVKWKQRPQITCFRVFDLYLVSVLCCTILLLFYVLTGWQVVILKFVLEGYAFSKTLACTNVSPEWASADMNTDFSMFHHTYWDCFAISSFSDSSWDLEAKPRGCKLASQTVSLTVKPWTSRLEGLVS